MFWCTTHVLTLKGMSVSSIPTYFKSLELLLKHRFGYKLITLLVNFSEHSINKTPINHLLITQILLFFFLHKYTALFSQMCVCISYFSIRVPMIQMRPNTKTQLK